MSQADLTMDEHSTGLTVGTGVFDSYEEAGDVAVHHRRHHDFCRVPGGLRISCAMGAANWPRPFHSITNVALMTFILLTSSLTMLIGLRAARAGDKAKAFLWIMITAAAGYCSSPCCTFVNGWGSLAKA